MCWHGHRCLSHCGRDSGTWGKVELPNVVLHQCCFEDLQVVENMFAPSVS